MRIRALGVLAAALLLLLGLAASTAQAAPARRQPGGEQVPTCVRGDWESTGVVLGRDAPKGFEVSGGDGVTLTIDENGEATIDFTGMQPATFEGRAHGQTTAGFVELRGTATGTVRTDDADGSGGLEVAQVTRQDVEVTVVLTEPVNSRPLDRVPLSDLQQLAERKGDAMTPEVTYECGDETLTITMRGQDDDHQDGRDDDRGGPHHSHELVWTFERPGAPD